MISLGVKIGIVYVCMFVSLHVKYVCTNMVCVVFLISGSICKSVTVLISEDWDCGFVDKGGRLVLLILFTCVEIFNHMCAQFSYKFRKKTSFKKIEKDRQQKIENCQLNYNCPLNNYQLKIIIQLIYQYNPVCFYPLNCYRISPLQKLLKIILA